MLAPDDVEELMNEQGEGLSAHEIDDLHEFYDQFLRKKPLSKILDRAESWIKHNKIETPVKSPKADLNYSNLEMNTHVMNSSVDIVN